MNATVAKVCCETKKINVLDKGNLIFFSSFVRREHSSSISERVRDSIGVAKSSKQVKEVVPKLTV